MKTATRVDLLGAARMAPPPTPLRASCVVLRSSALWPQTPAARPRHPHTRAPWLSQAMSTSLSNQHGMRSSTPLCPPSPQLGHHHANGNAITPHTPSIRPLTSRNQPSVRDKINRGLGFLPNAAAEKAIQDQPPPRLHTQATAPPASWGLTIQTLTVYPYATRREPSPISAAQ